jgi:hypothetical protein
MAAARRSSEIKISFVYLKIIVQIFYSGILSAAAARGRPYESSSRGGGIEPAGRRSIYMPAKCRAGQRRRSAAQRHDRGAQ